jgi:hypothetical protein
VRGTVVSIRTGLIAAVAGLSLIATGTLAWRAKRDWQALSGAAAAQEADIAANRFAAGLFEVLTERLATHNALQAAAPASPEELREIERRRAAVQENLQPGLAALSAREFPGRDALLRDLRAALDRADTARREADEALRRDCIPTMTASVNAALAMWFSASDAVAASDPVLARLAVAKEIGWHLRDTAGIERSNVASTMSAGQPAPARRRPVGATRWRSPASPTRQRTSPAPCSASCMRLLAPARRARRSWCHRPA